MNSITGNAQQNDVQGKKSLWIRPEHLHFIFVPAVIFAYFFSVDILDIRNIGWLLRGDLGMSFIGWHAFRYDEWHWPITWTYLLSSPDGIPISATDSNTLASLVLKPFSSLLPNQAQFIGPWILLSVYLTYTLSHATLRRLASVGDPPVDWGGQAAVIVGAALITLAPYLYFRVSHNTLISQWIILAAIYGFLFERDVRQVVVFCLLIGITVLVHPYFTPMVLPFAGAAALRSFFPLRHRLNARLLWGTLGVPAISYAAVLTTTYVLTGLWRVQGQTASPAGYFTMDPLAWFNSMGYSPILAGWEVGPGQYEGYQYLGLGVIVAAAVALCAIAMRRAAVPTAIAQQAPWLMICIATLFALAVSPVVTVFGEELIDTGIQNLPVVGELFTIFRSSGRLFWPASYLVGIFAISTLLVVRRPWARWTLLGCLALQIFDLAPAAKIGHRVVSQPRTTPAIASTSEWDQLLQHSKEIIFMPADFIEAGESERNLFFELMALALPRGVTSNNMYVARVNHGSNSPATRIDAMLSGPTGTWLTNDRLIVLTEEFASKLACSPDAQLDTKTLFRLDGVIVVPGLSLDLPTTVDSWSCPRW